MAGDGGEPTFEWDEDSHGLADAESYQHEFVGPMFRPSAEALLARVPCRPGDRVLDAGCGTGVVALLAVRVAGEDGRVTGLDLSPAQLTVARSLDGADGVDWIRGDVTDLPFADASFDVAYCHHVLPFVPARVEAARELRRVLAPGGRVGVATWGALELHAGFAAVSGALAAAGDADAAAMVASPRALADGKRVAAVLEEAGFIAVEASTAEVDVRFPSARLFVERLLEEDDRAAVRDDALARLSAREADGELAFRDEVVVVSGVAP